VGFVDGRVLFAMLCAQAVMLCSGRRLRAVTVLSPLGDSVAHPSLVRQAASARKQSFTAANPLALGVGGARSTGLQTPLGWLTGKLTGAGAR